MQQKAIHKLVTAAVLCALSIVLVMLIHFPLFPSASFLEYDPADIPLLLMSLLLGPWYALAGTVITSVIQGTTISAASGPVGIWMHVIATGTWVLITGSLYRIRKPLALCLIAGAAAMVLVMIPSNLFFNVKFFGMPREIVVAALPTAIIPFNVIKAGINSLVTGILFAKLGKRYANGQSFME